MLSDPMTLYKLMNLYMLKQVNFPLTNAQLSEFFLQHEYTNYFTLQQALNELQESGLVRAEGGGHLKLFRQQYISCHCGRYGQLFKRKPLPHAQ